MLFCLLIFLILFISLEANVRMLVCTYKVRRFCLFLKLFKMVPLWFISMLSADSVNPFSTHRLRIHAGLMIPCWERAHHLALHASYNIFFVIFVL